nr:uncharacterized protein LOC105348832 [Crassostrea gigas]
MTMTISSVEMCQEKCHHEKIHRFAVKMNKCLCIDHNIPQFNRLPASDCNFKCGGSSEDIYLDNCGGEKAYNIYETQRVNLNSVELCLSLQCSPDDKRFIPQKCSLILQKVCENMTLPDNDFASNWTLSMKQCKTSKRSTYLWGDFDLNKPRQTCERIPYNLQLVWIGVARQPYTSIDQGWEINENQTDTFLKCQLCTNNNCCFKSCYDLAASSIFCETILDTSQRQETGNVTALHESFNFLSNHLTAKQQLPQHSTTENCDEAKLPSIKDTHQKSSASNDLALKISLPLIFGIIILLLSAVGVVFYRRRSKMTKTDRTTRAEVESIPKTNVDSKPNPVQNQSYFVLEQCSQKIQTVSCSPSESPYNKSEDGVYDHLRDKKSRKPEVEDTYQHASAGINRNMSEYDTMANTDNKKQEEDASYDYSHQDTSEHYGYNSPPNTLLTGNAYDIAN